MNLNNFGEYIDDIIISRGYSYYWLENIISYCENKKGHYTFNVEGSEIYKVEIIINEDGEIEESSCNCPFDFGPICKHEVAVYYYLKELIINPVRKENIKKVNIKDVLMELPKEELIKIIIGITNNDRNLEQSIIYKYSKLDDANEISKYKNLLGSLIYKYLGREGYINYDRVLSFVYDMSNLFENGVEKALNSNNYLLALDIILIAMEEALEAFQYADDSDGGIGRLIDEITEKLDELITEVIENDNSKNEEIFNKLLDSMDIKAFVDWQDYRINLLGICFSFIEEEKYRKVFKKRLKELIWNEKDQVSDYYKEQMLMMLYEVIFEYESEEKADLFIEENLKYTSFRELLIDKHKGEENYSKIIDLALEGEKKDKNWAGLVTKWKKIRYEAYKSLSLNEEQENLARELLLNGDFEYYIELKSMYKGKEGLIYNEIIDQIQEDKKWYWSNIYIKLIEFEKDINRILEYVKNNPSRIEHYASILMDEYSDEVINIYVDHIFSISKLASDRKRYKEVCRSIEGFSRFASIEDVNNIIKELNISYRKRPAFLDELSKIK